MNQQHKRTRIKGAAGKASARLMIDVLPDDEEWEMLLKPYRKNATAAQRSLTRVWARQWAEHFGESEDSAYIKFKALFVLPLLLEKQEPEGIGYLHASAQEALWSGDTGPMAALHRMISAEGLSVEERSHLLTQYQRYAAEQGLIFTTRNQWYEEAMKWTRQKRQE